jgi:hypothetical protein
VAAVGLVGTAVLIGLTVWGLPLSLLLVVIGGLGVAFGFAVLSLHAGASLVRIWPGEDEPPVWLRTALGAAGLGGLVAFVSLFTTRRRVRRTFVAFVLAVALVGVPLSPLIVTWLARGESASQLASLTGRTRFWGYVFAEQRNTTQKILGDGISNGSINGKSFTNGLSAESVDGLPIDNSWVEDYQDQGLAGDVLTGLMFVVLLVTAAFAPRGPRRALALFLLLYCLAASFTEDGAGIASQYAMDMTVAASLIVPEVSRRRARWGARRPMPQLEAPPP